MRCQNCGKPKPEDGYSTCERCRELMRQYQKRAREKNKLKTKPRKRKPMQGLENTLSALRKYNEEHGTRLTYGKYTSMLRQGVIKSQEELDEYCDNCDFIKILNLKERNRKNGKLHCT